MATFRDDEIAIKLHRPGFRERIFFFASGTIVSVPLTFFIDAFTNNLCVVLPIFYARLCSTILFTPFIEEFAKAYPLFYRHGETERSIFILGFLVGFGFGITEFLLYRFALGVPIHVRLPGLFFHPASTSITAYGIAKKRPPLFYMIATVLHLLNNLFALFNQFWFIGGVAAIAIAYFLSWRLYLRTSERLVD